nr:MAG TPA: hypothetical protein [Caudoviricetes sp.]
MKHKLNYSNSTLNLYYFLRLRSLIEKIFFYIRNLVKRAIEKCHNS